MLLTGQLTEAVRRKPYGWYPISQDPLLLLTDTISSCYPLRRTRKGTQGVLQCRDDHGTFCLPMKPQDVAMILLQILDEGSITDSQGRKVDFKVLPMIVLLRTLFNLSSPEHNHLSY